MFQPAMLLYRSVVDGYLCRTFCLHSSDLHKDFNNNSVPRPLLKHKGKLVGGFNPFEKYDRQNWESSPNRGEHSKNIWNHHHHLEKMDSERPVIGWPTVGPITWTCFFEPRSEFVRKQENPNGWQNCVMIPIFRGKITVKSTHNLNTSFKKLPRKILPPNRNPPWKYWKITTEIDGNCNNRLTYNSYIWWYWNSLCIISNIRQHMRLQYSPITFTDSATLPLVLFGCF